MMKFDRSRFALVLPLLAAIFAGAALIFWQARQGGEPASERLPGADQLPGAEDALQRARPDWVEHKGGGIVGAARPEVF